MQLLHVELREVLYFVRRTARAPNAVGKIYSEQVVEILAAKVPAAPVDQDLPRGRHVGSREVRPVHELALPILVEIDVAAEPSVV